MGTIAQALQALVPVPGSGRSSPGRVFAGGWGDSFAISASRFRLPGERDYAATVGDGSGTSLITAAVNWMGRELIPARPILLQYPADGEAAAPQVLRAAPVVRLLRSPTVDPELAPTGFYSGTVLNMACAASWIVDGNVYRLKVRSQEGNVVQRWYVPHYCIEPVGEGTTFISSYRYRVGGATYYLDPRDVDHLRFGLDPHNPRKGLSPIRGVLREIFTDEEAARFSAALLHNLGFPGAVVIPGQGVNVKDKNVRDEIRDTFDERFGGENRGRTIVLSANAEVKFLQWNPQELALGDLRDVPEERVSAVLGIPAAVLGFGTGLQQVKVGATMKELREMGWEGALLPFLYALAENDSQHLLPEFYGEEEVARYEIGWDLSRISALSGRRKDEADRAASLVREKIIQVDEARIDLGYSPVGPDRGGGFSTGSSATTPAGSAPAAAAAEESETIALSPRELAVAEAVTRGESNKEIAGALGLTERTVERYLAIAREKVGAGSRAELAAWIARRAG